MPWLMLPLVLALAALAGSPWLLAHCALRRRQLRFIKMRRNRAGGR